MLKIGFFNPVVSDWNEEAQEREVQERNRCDVCLYVLTPRMQGFYAAVEAALDSAKRPGKVILCVLDEDRGKKWNSHDTKSIRKMKELIRNEGATVCETLAEVAELLNG